jgi:Co/Zn/Cd efflux system component
MALSFHTLFNVMSLSLTLLAMLCARLSPTASYTYG